jgi:NAD(P)-dependent dehydrogenase (short-subunit alcohol dehydrogenase family)
MSFRRNLVLGTSVVAVAFAVYTQTQNMASLASIRASNAANAASFVGRRAVVVGGTSGIGEGLAKRLAEGNYSVSIVGRSAERGNAIVEEMKRLNPTGQHDFLSCNAFLLKDVERAANEFKAKHPGSPVDVLVLTQGIGTFQGRTETTEGIDEKLALHFYSRMGFIHQLLPQLKKSPSPRVLSVLAAGMHPPYAHWKDDTELKTHYSLKNAADAGCFYNDLALDALAKKEDKILFAHANPGFVDTRVSRNMVAPLRWIVNGLAAVFATSPKDAAEYLGQPLLKSDEDVAKLRAEEKGAFLMGPSGQKVGKTSLHDDEKANFIWNHAVEVIKRCGVSDPAPLA